jgi:hypothetical protein
MTQFSTGNRDKTVGIYSYTSNISIVIRGEKDEDKEDSKAQREDCEKTGRN